LRQHPPVDFDSLNLSFVVSRLGWLLNITGRYTLAKACVDNLDRVGSYQPLGGFVSSELSVMSQ